MSFVATPWQEYHWNPIDRRELAKWRRRAEAYEREERNLRIGAVLGEAIYRPPKPGVCVSCGNTAALGEKYCGTHWINSIRAEEERMRRPCTKCKKNPIFAGSRAKCFDCLVKDRERKRRDYGCKSRAESGIGRRPIEDKQAFMEAAKRA